MDGSVNLVVTSEFAEKLAEGVKKINDQHKKIFELTTDLFAHCVGDDNAENTYFGRMINGAVELVTTHFKTEEELMLETKFNLFEYIEHKKEHEDFVATVIDYLTRFKKTGSVDLLMFSSYAKWWVIGHIRRHDKKYITFFNKILETNNIRHVDKMAV
ncbi:MAG: hemerythrin domain-containing protein [Treponema sp.]|jgi:hemerythrin|nr:hemerythrin domain-containing protein [Treponema sp.]